MNGGDVVKAYVDARADAGLTTSKPFKAILGRYAKVLLAQGWSDAVVLAAARDYAATQRHPRFLEEWVRETDAKWSDIDHAVRKAEEREPMSAEVMAAILAGTHGAPLIRRIPDVDESVSDAQLRRVKAGPRCYECALSGRMDQCNTCAYAIQMVKENTK